MSEFPASGVKQISSTVVSNDSGTKPRKNIILANKVFLNCLKLFLNVGDDTVNF